MKILFLTLIVLLLPRDAYATINIETDYLWKASKTLYSNWETVTFDDSAWVHTIAPSMGRCPFRQREEHFTHPIWHPIPQEGETVYLRKLFDISESIVSARLLVNFDDDGEAYINSTQVIKDTSRRTEKIPFIVDITEHVVKGENVLALMAQDSRGGCQWAQAKITIETEAGVILSVPLLKQTDVRWADDEYDHGSKQNLFCGTDIAGCGCVITSLAMLLGYYDVSADPGSLNEYFNQDEVCSADGCISRGYVFGNVRWNAINGYSRNMHEAHGTTKVQFVAGDVYDFQKARDEIEHERPLILKARDFSHWFIGTGISGENITINDPFFDETLLNGEKYKNSASKIRTFKKVNSDFSLIEVFVEATGSAIIADQFGRRTGIDISSQSIWTEIPRSSYDFEEYIDSPLSPEHEGGLHWFMISLPASGMYNISVSGKGAVYVSDMNAQEKKHLGNSFRGTVQYANNDIQNTHILLHSDFTNISYKTCTMPAYYQF